LNGPLAQTLLTNIFGVGGLDQGPGELTNFMFNLSDEAEFYKPTVPNIHPSISGITAHATIQGRLEHYIITLNLTLLIQMNGA
jgi:hypothetical protein